jgi:hypothetical protein
MTQVQFQFVDTARVIDQGLDRESVAPIVPAIIAQENANYAYPVAILNAGFALAGVV